MKLKEFGPQGAHVPRAPLRSATADLTGFLIVKKIELTWLKLISFKFELLTSSHNFSKREKIKKGEIFGCSSKETAWRRLFVD